MVQPTRAWLLDVLATLGVATGLLDDATLHLFTAGTPSPDAVEASFTEADYTGYAAQTIADTAWGTPFLAGGTIPTIKGPLSEFRPTGTTVTNVVTGWYLLNAAADTVIASGLFAAPVSLLSPSTALFMVPEFQLDPSANYGDPMVEY